MNPYLRPFLAALLVPGCIGGGKEETTDSGTPPLDDEVCFTVALDDACLEGDAAKEAYEGAELCEDPLRTVLVVGELLEENVVAQTAYGSTLPAETGDTGTIRRACCYAVATETDPNVGCTPGRPFTTAGIAHVGHATPRGDWRSEVAPSTDGLPPVERAALAAAWLADALAEHASVPAFGRLAVELAGHGAPPELLARCAEAMADEVRHARDCFAVASTYAGEPLGPGPVAAPARPLPTLVDLALDTFHEGCIGESLAAGRAAVQLGQATDPAIRRVLARIVDDETRHAELAWAILRWTIQVGGVEVRTALTAASHDLSVPAPAPGPVVAAHGLPPTNQVSTVLRQMIHQVVEPTVRDLLAA
jgi:hypothetical protein